MPDTVRTLYCPIRTILHYTALVSLPWNNEKTNNIKLSLGVLYSTPTHIFHRYIGGIITQALFAEGPFAGIAMEASQICDILTVTPDGNLVFEQVIFWLHHDAKRIQVPYLQIVATDPASNATAALSISRNHFLHTAAPTDRTPRLADS